MALYTTGNAIAYENKGYLVNNHNDKRALFFTFYLRGKTLEGNDELQSTKFSIFVSEQDVGTQMFDALMQGGRLTNCKVFYNDEKLIYGEREYYKATEIEADFYEGADADVSYTDLQKSTFTNEWPHFYIKYRPRWSDMSWHKKPQQDKGCRKGHSIDLFNLSPEIWKRVERIQEERNKDNNLSDYDCL